MTFSYPRTPTSAVIRVTFTNGEVYEIPAQVVADSYDESYASEQSDIVSAIRSGQLDASVLEEWAINNMNWSDVSAMARRVDVSTPPFDYQGGWLSADREVVGEI